MQRRDYGRILEKTSGAGPGRAGRGRGGRGGGGAGLSAEASGLRKTLAPDSLRLAGGVQGGLQSPFFGFLLAFASPWLAWRL